jgi:MoxR-like ATPase
MDDSVPPSQLLEHLERVVVGKRPTLVLMLAALLADGHVLIEDVPGLAKTLAARALARILSLRFARAQMTPDLLPADLTGTSIWDEQKKEFVFRPGPIFTQVLLVDELNRATPRTQAGLLEAMEERTVSAEGKRHDLPQPFFVIATQNPIEQFGVFPLPEAQLDRFLIHLGMGYPTEEEERAIVHAQRLAHPLESLEPLLDAAGLARLREAARVVHVSEPVLDYIVKITRSTRGRDQIALGASPRASIAMHRMGRALALIEGEQFVRPDHVKRVAPAVLRHRIILTPQARLAGASADEIIRRLLDSIEAPVYEPADETSSARRAEG